MPPAGICAGGSGQPESLPRPLRVAVRGQGTMERKPAARGLTTLRSRSPVARRRAVRLLKPPGLQQTTRVPLGKRPYRASADLKPRGFARGSGTKRFEILASSSHKMEKWPLSVILLRRPECESHEAMRGMQWERAGPRLSKQETLKSPPPVSKEHVISRSNIMLESERRV